MISIKKVHRVSGGLFTYKYDMKTAPSTSRKRHQVIAEAITIVIIIILFVKKSRKEYQILMIL